MTTATQVPAPSQPSASAPATAAVIQPAPMQTNSATHRVSKSWAKGKSKGATQPAPQVPQPPVPQPVLVLGPAVRPPAQVAQAQPGAQSVMPVPPPPVPARPQWPSNMVVWFAGTPVTLVGAVGRRGQLPPGPPYDQYLPLNPNRSSRLSREYRERGYARQLLLLAVPGLRAICLQQASHLPAG